VNVTKVEGICAKHAIITDVCRRNRGDEDAVEEALLRARNALSLAMKGWDVGRGVKFHVVVTVERPDPDGPRTDCEEGDEL
jgi:hypothetical protein